MRNLVHPVLIVALLGLAGSVGAQSVTSFQLTLVNSGRHTISAAQVSPKQSPDWGDNLLAAPLGPQQRATVTVPGDCGSYDIRFIAEKGARLHDEDLSLCGGDTLTIGDQTIKKEKPKN